MVHRLIFIFIIFLLQAESSLSQNQQIDSLEKIIARSKKDTIKVDALLALAKIYFSENPKLSIKYSSEAESISKQLAYSRGSANALKQIGIGHYLQSEYFEAVQAWTAALSEFKKSKDIIGEANILSNLGAVYFNQADEPKALDYYLKSLQLAERTNDSLRLATVLLNIGGIYRKDPEKALEYFLRALPIARGIKDRDAIGTVTVNLGENYLARGEYQKALEYLNESLAAYESSENIPYSYILVGKVYAKMGNHDKALENQFKALEISKELNIQLHIAQALLAIGSTYKDKEDHENAIKYFLQGISVAEKINANVELKMLYEGVSNSYYKKKEFDEAYKFQNLLLGIKDSLYNNESDKKLNNLMFNYEIDKKESKITLLTKDKEIQQQVIQRQRLVRNSFIAGFAIVMIFAGIFFRQRNRISIEKQKSELLLLNILPEETAEELKATGAAKAKSFEEVTVLFTDFKDFTKLAEHLSPKDLVNEINDCFSTFDRIMEKYGIEKIKTIGDSYMAAGGLPTPNKTHASDVVKAAIEIRSFMLEHKEKKALTGESSFGIRIGVHTGPVVAGIVGVKKFQYDIWGDTVNTASRMESSGEVGKVNISGATYARIKDEFTCLHRGKIDAKNKGQIDMYFVEGPANA